MVKLILLLFMFLKISVSLPAEDLKLSPVQIRVPETIKIKSRSFPVSSKPGIKNLKAVLLGAPIDGDSGNWTKKEIENLKLAAGVLRANGVTVYEFYTPNNNWEKIKEAANGAHFLLYRGHGVYDGSNPVGNVGGFGLKDKFASSDDIRRELKLYPGAIVMLYGCFTAGNAGFDIGRINESEAKRRVAMYSRPFMEMGFSGYYANWFGDAFQFFLAHLFSGKTLGESFKSYHDFNENTVNYDRHSEFGDKVIWVDHDKWSGGVAYNNAFVGNPDKTLLQLFGSNSGEKIITLEQMGESLRLNQSDKYYGKVNGRDTWNWSIFFEGNEKDLNQITKVVYHLHPTFNEPNPEVYEGPENGFIMNRQGWGTFQVGATVYFNNGSTKKYSINLTFTDR